MTSLRQLVAVLVAVGMSTGGSAPAAGSSVGAGLTVRQKTSSAATLPRRKPAATPKPAAVPPKAGEAPASYIRSDDPSALADHLAAALNGKTRSGQWGAIVVSLTNGDTLFAQNADGPMLPASTMKMYTSAVALDHFGADYVFRTPVLREAQVGPDGILGGNLYLRGVGDPSLSSRFWKGETPMDALARLVVQAGIKRVRGDVVGDASLFDQKTIPDGWKRSYLGAAYAARVSALSLNENLVWVAVKANGDAAEVSLEPATTTIPFRSTVRVIAGRGGRITASRQSDGSILVRGTVGRNAGTRKYSLVVEDPALFTTGALVAALEKAGVKVDGIARVGSAPDNAIEVAALTSPPLSPIVGEMNRESINVVAELLFRAAAASSGQVGSAESGMMALREFFSEKVKARADLLSVTDGSGLSELDRVTPRSMVSLLGYAHASDWSSEFHASLPVEGESGTLRTRRAAPSRGNLHAKTGTTNRVASLGGYVTARNGEILAFSFIYNGSDRWNARSAMDAMGATLAEFSRPR